MRQRQPATLKAGDRLTYTLLYRNNGPREVSGVVITDVIPITLTDFSAIHAGAQITPTGDVSYTWQVENLSPGEGGAITITGIVSPPINRLYTLANAASITATDYGFTEEHLGDQHLYNNESVARSTVVPYRMYLPLIMHNYS